MNVLFVHIKLARVECNSKPCLRAPNWQMLLHNYLSLLDELLFLNKHIHPYLKLFSLIKLSHENHILGIFFHFLLFINNPGSSNTKRFLNTFALSPSPLPVTYYFIPKFIHFKKRLYTYSVDTIHCSKHKGFKSEQKQTLIFMEFRINIYWSPSICRMHSNNAVGGNTLTGYFVLCGKVCY